MKIVFVLIVFFLTACSSLGVQNMTEGQIKATAGMATCTTFSSMYGKGHSVTVNMDDTRKGATSKSKVTMSPDCAVTIEGDVGVAPTK